MTIPSHEPTPDRATAGGDPPAEGARRADDLGFALPPPAQISRARAIAIAGGVALLLGGAFLARWLPARHGQKALAEDTRSALDATPRVQIVSPTVISSDRSLSLPGSVQSLEETVVYPRANGYVRAWHKDLGDKVSEGDLLAEIDTPELDQQLAQARAQLAQAEAGLTSARANAAFSKQNLERGRQLAAEGLASQQDLEKQKAQAAVDEASIGVAIASVGAQRANAEVLGRLRSFSRVTAPFGGTVVSRTVERGMLVTAGTGTPLFKIAATDPVRVLLQVPQGVAPSVRTGVAAGVAVREFPGRAFAGTVARSAGALDPATRTMAVEVRVPNPKGELMTGMYAQVSLALPTPHAVMALPATALMNDANGLRVAIVDGEGKIRLVPVVLERDTGPTVEIASGIAGDARVVKLPSAELFEGRAVEIAR